MVADDAGRPLTGAQITVYPFIFGAGGSPTPSASTDARGFYEVGFEGMEDAGGSIGTVIARREGYELDGAFLGRRTPADTVRNFRLYPVKRIVPGESVTITVNPGDPPCGFDWEWVCRTVRLVPATSGTLAFSLITHSGGSQTGLQVTTPQPPGIPFRPVCCSSQVSVAVTGGREVIAEIFVSWTTTDAHSFTLQTTLTPQG